MSSSLPPTACLPAVPCSPPSARLAFLDYECVSCLPAFLPRPAPSRPPSSRPPQPDKPAVSEEFAIKMEASLKTWVSAWDSKGYSPDQLDKGGCERRATMLL